MNGSERMRFVEDLSSTKSDMEEHINCVFCNWKLYRISIDSLNSLITGQRWLLCSVYRTKIIIINTLLFVIKRNLVCTSLFYSIINAVELIDHLLTYTCNLDKLWSGHILAESLSARWPFDLSKCQSWHLKFATYVQLCWFRRIYFILCEKIHWSCFCISWHSRCICR